MPTRVRTAAMEYHTRAWTPTPPRSHVLCRGRTVRLPERCHRHRPRYRGRHGRHVRQQHLFEDIRPSRPCDGFRRFPRPRRHQRLERCMGCRGRRRHGPFQGRRKRHERGCRVGFHRTSSSVVPRPWWSPPLYGRSPPFYRGPSRSTGRTKAAAYVIRATATTTPTMPHPTTVATSRHHVLRTIVWTRCARRVPPLYGRTTSHTRPEYTGHG